MNLQIIPLTLNRPLQITVFHDIKEQRQWISTTYTPCFLMLFMRKFKSELLYVCNLLIKRKKEIFFFDFYKDIFCTKWHQPAWERTPWNQDQPYVFSAEQFFYFFKISFFLGRIRKWLEIIDHNSVLSSFLFYIDLICKNRCSTVITAFLHINII